MKHQKIFHNYFEKPVIWLDEAEQPLVKASLDGTWISEGSLGACMFHFELQEDGRSVQVSISEGSRDLMVCNHTSFNGWPSTALSALIEGEHITVVDRCTYQPLFKKSGSGFKF